MAEMLPIDMLRALLLVALVGVMLGAVVILVGRRRAARPPVPPVPATGDESPRHEAQRYFLMNETGNVLISTSLSPTGQLPDATLAQFSEALAHLSAIFFAVAGTKDPDTGQPFSLYNYAVIKKALELHPVFIRMSSEKPKVSLNRFRTGYSPLYQIMGAQKKSPEMVREEKKKWFDERVNYSRQALGMNDSPENLQRLRTIHAQMRAEAKRMGRQQQVMGVKAPGLVQLMQAPSTQEQAEVPDDMEIGHITLYCECLMGVSLVSVKLVHAYYEDYLYADSLEKMEYDTYLFVSPSQLRKTMNEVNNLPRVHIDAAALRTRDPEGHRYEQKTATDLTGNLEEPL